MDTLYFLNNIWRGNEVHEKFEVDYYANLGIAWPIVAIVLKMRAIFYVTLFKKQKPMHHFGLNIQATMKKLTSRIDKARKRKTTMGGVRAAPYAPQHGQCLLLQQHPLKVVPPPAQQQPQTLLYPGPLLYAGSGEGRLHSTQACPCSQRLLHCQQSLLRSLPIEVCLQDSQGQ